MRLGPRIVADVNIRFGRPVIEGTRIPIDLVIGKLASGMSYGDIMHEYAIEKEDILAVLLYASKHIDGEEVTDI